MPPPQPRDFCANMRTFTNKLVELLDAKGGDCAKAWARVCECVRVFLFFGCVVCVWVCVFVSVCSCVRIIHVTAADALI